MDVKWTTMQKNGLQKRSSNALALCQFYSFVLLNISLNFHLLMKNCGTVFENPTFKNGWNGKSPRHHFECWLWFSTIATNSTWLQSVMVAINLLYYKYLITYWEKSINVVHVNWNGITMLFMSEEKDIGVIFSLFISVSDTTKGRGFCYWPCLQSSFWFHCQPHMWGEGGEFPQPVFIHSGLQDDHCYSHRSQMVYFQIIYLLPKMQLSWT